MYNGVTIIFTHEKVLLIKNYYKPKYRYNVKCQQTAILQSIDCSHYQNAYQKLYITIISVI